MPDRSEEQRRRPGDCLAGILARRAEGGSPFKLYRKIPTFAAKDAARMGHLIVLFGQTKACGH
jgi:hypothetical protein